MEPHDESTEMPVCAAFPDGIPFEISYGDNDHLMPVEGDHGIQYESPPVNPLNGIPE